MFCKIYRTKQHTSSPHYPSGNGFAEKIVSIEKNIMRKCGTTNLNVGLLDCRNTPIPRLDFSSVELLMCHKLRDRMPSTVMKKLEDAHQKIPWGIRDQEECNPGDGVYFKGDPNKTLEKRISPTAASRNTHMLHCKRQRRKQLQEKQRIHTHIMA